jgi:flavin-dependent amine oxidoreductase
LYPNLVLGSKNDRVIGQDRLDQAHAYAAWRTRNAKARQGNIFFAGEHCSVDYQGYMEGGFPKSRAAKEILD